MKFVCDRCQTRYSIADEKVRQRIIRIRCKTCGNVITVQAGEVVPGPQDSSRRPEPGGWAGTAPALGVSAKLSRPASGSHEWFVAVDGAEQGPLSCTDAAKYVVSLKSEQSVHVWKEGMDGWKRPEDVAIIAQEISTLRRPPAASSPRAPTRDDFSSTPRPVPADSVARLRVPGTRPNSPPALGSGSGPKLSQPGIRGSDSKLSRPLPGSGPKVAPIPGSGPKVAPPPIPGSGPKVAPPPIPGSGPKAPPRVPGSGPKAPPQVPGSGPKLAPLGGSGPEPAPHRVSGSHPLPGGLSPKKGPALPGLTPSSPGPPSPSATPALEAEFDKAPVTRPEKRPSRAQGVASLGTPLPEVARPTQPRERVSEDEFDQAQKTPLPGNPLPPIAAAAGDGRGGKNWPPPPLTLPGLSAGSLFGNVATLPAPSFQVAHAAPGLSRLTGLAALVHRHRHLKYVVAACVVIVLVILVMLLSWRGETAKAVPSALERAAPGQEAPSLDQAETPQQDEPTVGPEVEPRRRTAERVASRRSAPSRSAGPPAKAAVVGEDPFEGPSKRSAPARSAGPSAKAAVVGKDPFEGPSPSSRRAERPIVPVAARSGPSVGGGKTVSQVQIAEVVRSKENLASIKTCYERAMSRDGRSRTGRLDVTVSVGGSGTVQRVQVHGPSDFLIIEGCIKNAIRHWHFPVNSEEYATSFPLILTGDSP